MNRSEVLDVLGDKLVAKSDVVWIFENPPEEYSSLEDSTLTILWWGEKVVVISERTSDNLSLLKVPYAAKLLNSLNKNLYQTRLVVDQGKLEVSVCLSDWLEVALGQ
jgi:hypothetical protein